MASHFLFSFSLYHNYKYSSLRRSNSSVGLYEKYRPYQVLLPLATISCPWVFMLSARSSFLGPLPLCRDGCLYMRTSWCSALHIMCPFPTLDGLHPPWLAPGSVLTSWRSHSQESQSSFAAYRNFLFFIEHFIVSVLWFGLVGCARLAYVSVHLSLIQPRTHSQSCDSLPNTFKHIRPSIHLISVKTAFLEASAAPVWAGCSQWLGSNGWSENLLSLYSREVFPPCSCVGSLLLRSRSFIFLVYSLVFLEHIP